MHPDPRDPASGPDNPASRETSRRIPATHVSCHQARRVAPDPGLRRFREGGGAQNPRKSASGPDNPRNSASGPANPHNSRFASPDMPLHDAVAPFDTPSHTTVTGMVVAVVSNGCTFPEATVTGACRRIPLLCVGPSVMEIMCGFQRERKHRARLERPCGKRASVMRGASCGKPSPLPQHRFNPPVNRCFHAFDKPLRLRGRGSVIKPCAAGRPQFHYSSAKRRPYSLFFRKAF